MKTKPKHGNRKNALSNNIVRGSIKDSHDVVSKVLCIDCTDRLNEEIMTNLKAYEAIQINVPRSINPELMVDQLRYLIDSINILENIPIGIRISANYLRFLHDITRSLSFMRVTDWNTSLKSESSWSSRFPKELFDPKLSEKIYASKEIDVISLKHVNGTDELNRSIKNGSAVNGSAVNGSILNGSSPIKERHFLLNGQSKANGTSTSIDTFLSRRTKSSSSNPRRNGRTLQQSIRHRRDISLSFDVKSPPKQSSSTHIKDGDFLKAGISCLIITWVLFIVGMGYILDIWSPKTIITTYGNYEEKTDLPIPGYYFSMTMLSLVIVWIWCISSWTGMKFFRHSKGGD